MLRRLELIAASLAAAWGFCEVVFVLVRTVFERCARLVADAPVNVRWRSFSFVFQFRLRLGRFAFAGPETVVFVSLRRSTLS